MPTHLDVYKYMGRYKSGKMEECVNEWKNR